MKYKMMRDLPFIKSGEVFGTGCWVGGGWGVDKGNDSRGAHNGIRVFEPHEDLLLTKLILNKEWVRIIPETVYEALRLYQDGYFRVEEMLDMFVLRKDVK